MGGGRLLVFGKDAFFEEIYFLIKHKSIGFQKLTWVHGDKDKRQVPHRELSDSESIGVFYRKCDKQLLKLPNRDAHSDILRYKKDRVYGSMKPPALMQHLVRRYSKAGDWVADLCMGERAVTGVAAVREGRSFYGIEKRNTAFMNSLAALQS